MKKIVFIIIIAFFLKPVFPVIDYVINYEYISKTLCINKAKPELKCNGKCQLMKELAKSTETDNPINSNKKIGTNEFEVLFFQNIEPFQIMQVHFYINSYIGDNYSNHYFYSNSCSFFRPPNTIS